MSAIEKVEQDFERLESTYPGALVHAFMTHKEFRAALAEAWEMGYAASDYEAYHLGTHGRTDNPFKEES